MNRTQLNKNNFFSWIGLMTLIISLGVGACSDNKEAGGNEQEKKLAELIDLEMSLRCTMDSIRMAVKEEWDLVNQKLDAGVPADMPEEEKRNMLKVRNAPLIRMFESYETLDSEIRMAVDKAEEMDRFMAGRISEINRQVRNLEDQRFKIYSEVEMAGEKEGLDKIKEDYNKLLNDPCGQQ